KLKTEVTVIESSVATLAPKLGGILPKSFVELCARLKALSTSESYQQFDAAVRESYTDKDRFAEAFGQYVNAQKLRDRDLELSQAWDYLAAAAPLGPHLEMTRDALVSQLDFN